ncbi:MAG TPA: UDP-N-acetylmuramoyl-L-alanine--D-glutamate ligase [Bacteroidales bacterium]|nr:UDP-N-acetylmuramoyl-L-alanine--D-glutamate ligase [Bacteroidales bacterium]
MKKKITILGCGESGMGAALLAKDKGFDVFVSDSSPIKDEYKQPLLNAGIPFEEKLHTEERILASDLIVKSPGIPEKAPIIKALRSKKIDIISEIEFAAQYTTAKIIAITGSNGKTTTTLLTYHIMQKAGLNVGLAGNVGKSFALSVLQHKYDYYVLEISSFQLDDIVHFKPHIAILMNITPDHLDRYNYNFQNYIDSKFLITKNQTEDDYFIYCYDDEVIQKNIETKNIRSKRIPFSIQTELENGGYVYENQLNININKNKFVMSIQDLALEGKHNQYNSLAAGIATFISNIRKEAIRESLSDFEAVEHRLEKVLKIRGIDFINDSKATNVNSTWYALETVKKPIIWIVGGVDKGNDYSQLEELVKEKVKAIVCLGVDNSKIIRAFEHLNIPIYDTKSMEEAVRTSYKNGVPGDVVLLSPACASFDLFQNYEDRGRKFKNAVRDL